MRLSVIFVLLALFSSQLRGQYALNKCAEAGVSYVYHNDSIKRLDFVLGTVSCLDRNTWITYDSIALLPEVMRVNAHPPGTVIQTRDTTIISFSGSGLVYTLGKNGKVQRHDRTYFSGYNFGAQRYLNSKRLWSIGGYGLWRVTDFALYYDPELREWERQRMTPNIIEGFGDGFYSVLDNEDRLRMVASSRHEFNSAEVKLLAMEVDLDARTYEIIGAPIVDLDIFNNSNDIGYSSNGLWNVVYDRGTVLLANLRDNRVVRTHHENTYARGFNGSNGILLHPDGVLLIETASTVTNNHVKVRHTTIQELLEDPTNEDLGAIYEPYWLHQVRQNIRVLLALFLAVVGVAGMIIRYRRSRPVSERAYADSLSPLARILIKHLMLMPSDHYISTEELNQILHVEDKTWDNQRKIRSTILQELEEKGMEHLGVPSFIERQASDEDRRIRRYRIKPELRSDLLPILKYV